MCYTSLCVLSGQVKFVVPRGNTRLVAGDRVIFVGPAAAIQVAQEQFLAKKAAAGAD